MHIVPVAQIHCVNRFANIVNLVNKSEFNCVINIPTSVVILSIWVSKIALQEMKHLNE